MYWTELAVRHGENGAFFFFYVADYNTLFSVCQGVFFIFSSPFAKSLVLTKFFDFFRVICGFTFALRIGIMFSQIAARVAVRIQSTGIFRRIKLMIR